MFGNPAAVPGVTAALNNGQPGPRDELDQRRAENYNVLAMLLASPPTAEILAILSTVAGDDTPLGQAWNGLAAAAAQADPAEVEREFFVLFTGVGRGELLPYASFYITGFLHERPLAELRGDLVRLGIARQDGDHEPEDRIALLCNVMAAYASGTLTPPAETEAPDEQTFFTRHLAPWAETFFEDLDQAPAARFYRAVAEIGRRFIANEHQSFALAAEANSAA